MSVQSYKLTAPQRLNSFSIFQPLMSCWGLSQNLHNLIGSNPEPQKGAGHRGLVVGLKELYGCH